MIEFNCSFYLASTPTRSIGRAHTYRITKSEMGIYGEVYTGNLIRSLGVHYGDYVNSTGAAIWRIHNLYSGPSVGRIQIHSEKHKSQAVTGNIGEAVVMPALGAAVGVVRIPFQRMKAHNLRCPDFRFYCDWVQLDRLWNTSCSSMSNLPNDMPLEVKTHLGRDEGYPLDALEQLLKYWYECSSNGYASAVGFGVIARVDLDVNKNSGSNHHFIRYLLFVPRTGFSLARFERGFKIIKSTDFKKKYKTEYKQKFIRWLGRYFI
ncbi:hypothetical protein AMQ84_26410 [Paenibacillus riograndensis]|uniref:Uncharacterized protein n=1 Tax=Paenibacillus riograndensis TaxID=483937 RepID=A0A132TLP5_9BACL|nr:hypothetical protein [Paenibacillus riograndensis]KWX72214.1 hypothetical protein AMQ84_26410 [Paenibacillus riograndensis]